MSNMHWMCFNFHVKESHAFTGTEAEAYVKPTKAYKNRENSPSINNNTSQDPT